MSEFWVVLVDLSKFVFPHADVIHDLSFYIRYFAWSEPRVRSWIVVSGDVSSDLHLPETIGDIHGARICEICRQFLSRDSVLLTCTWFPGVLLHPHSEYVVCRYHRVWIPILSTGWRICCTGPSYNRHVEIWR